MIFTRRNDTQFERWESKFSSIHDAVVIKVGENNYTADFTINATGRADLGLHESLEVAQQACRNYAIDLAQQMTAWAIASNEPIEL